MKRYWIKPNECYRTDHILTLEEMKECSDDYGLEWYLKEGWILVEEITADLEPDER